MNTEVTEIVKKAADRIEAVEKAQQDHATALAGINASLIDMAQRQPGQVLPGSLASVNALHKALAGDVLKPLIDRHQKSVRIALTSTIATLRKSTIVGAGNEASSGQDQFNVQPFRSNVIGGDARRRLSLLDVMPRLQINVNSFEFNRLTGYTNAAGYQVDEGDTKPEATFPTELETSRIYTIAHWIKASNQILADQPALQNYVGDLMNYGVLQKLENELISGSGTNAIAGLRATGNNNPFTPTTNATNAADKIGEALAALDILGWSGNVILMHPNDWQVMRSERATTSNEYLVGSWSSPAAPNVWGVPVVTSPAVPEGECFVMDSSQTMLLDRASPVIEVGYTDDDFTRNLVVLRAELRAGLAVLSPTAVLHFDI
jgi:HK97 family phage major capsid protein